MKTDKLKRDKIIWLVIFITALTLSVLGIFGAVIFSLKVQIIPLGFSLFFALLGIWFAPFSYIAFSNRRYAEKIIKLESGISDAEQCENELRFSPVFTEKIKKMCIKHGYLPQE